MEFPKPLSDFKPKTSFHGELYVDSNVLNADLVEHLNAIARVVLYGDFFLSNLVEVHQDL